MLDKVNEKYMQKVHNIVTAYHNYKRYHDRKASAQPLKVNECVFLLNPQYDDQSLKKHFKAFHWQGPYKVLKILSRSNNSIQQIGIHKTQFFHFLYNKMTLKTFKWIRSICIPTQMH